MYSRFSFFQQISIYFSVVNFLCVFEEMLQF